MARYAPDKEAAWNGFIRAGRNTHFFFDRGYMEYHAARFEDCSLLLSDDHGGLRGVLPANRAGDALYSHQGLSFGGLVVQRARGAEVMDMIRQACDFVARQGMRRLVYKTLPSLYHTQPSEDDRYVLHRLDARLIRRELSSVINLRAPFSYSGGKIDNLRRARKADLSFAEVADPQKVIELVATVLTTRHQATVTHTPAEMQLLTSRFPSHIRTFAASRSDTLLAGAVAFVTGAVVHTQYLVNSDEGRACGALDFVVDHLIRHIFADRDWFSFGISTEDAGQHLNEGLLAYKEGFGAYGMVYDTYELDL